MLEDGLTFVIGMAEGEFPLIAEVRVMAWTHRGGAILVALLLGVGIGYLFRGTPAPVWAANDRHEDYILCTGPVAVTANARTDGIWLLDYRTGKLLGTLIDRNNGKIANWAEVDLVGEFGLTPRHNVHFLMTTGSIAQGQAALPRRDRERQIWRLHDGATSRFTPGSGHPAT